LLLGCIYTNMLRQYAPLLTLTLTSGKCLPSSQSCLVRVGGVNRIGGKSGLSVTENYETVLSSLEMRCEQSFVWSRPSFQFTTRTCLQMRSHSCRQDWTKLFSLQYNEDYWKQSWLVASSVHTTDKIRRSCLVCSVVWTINVRKLHCGHPYQLPVQTLNLLLLLVHLINIVVITSNKQLPIARTSSTDGMKMLGFVRRLSVCIPQSPVNQTSIVITGLTHAAPTNFALDPQRVARTEQSQ